MSSQVEEHATPAVLFLVFNRPELTRRTMQALRQARPPRLYVAADGPRSGRAGEAERCGQARAIATAVDWPCAVQTLLRDTHRGCRRAVSEAISWFFGRESEGIILEDDCLPAPDFFRFCAFALEHWRDDKRVMHIGGSVLVPRPGEAVAMSRLVPIWGWATWARAWALYDDSMGGLPGLRGLPLRQWYGSQAANVARAMEAVYGRQLDAWGARWVLTVMSARALSVLPGVNLISNMGHGAQATHTTVASHLSDLALGSLPARLVAPAEMFADARYDEAYLAEMNRKRRLLGRIIARLAAALRGRRR